MARDPVITIRLATAADAHRLAELRYQFRAAFDPVNEDEAEFIARCSRWMQTRLQDNGSWRCWVAEKEQTILGHLWLYLLEKIPNPTDEPEYHAYLTNFYVQESARGRGVGAQILQTALDWSRARQAQTVILWPTPHSRSLYLRHGFEVSADILALELTT